MATKVVIDFDCNLVASQSTAPTSWENTAKPVGVYHQEGVLTRNPNVVTGIILPTPQTGRTTGGNSYGFQASITNVSSYLTNGTQIGVDRSVYSIGAEAWATFDVKYSLIASTAPYGVPSAFAIFRWGQVSVYVKTVTFTSPNWTVVYAVRNNATEVATVTVTDVTSTSWHYCKIHVKLDATTGLIDVNIDGFAQSVSYTGQNTVSSIVLASTGTVLTADFIYFGPPLAFGTATQANAGSIDNIGIFDTAFPAGRLIARRWSMGTTSTDTNWAAVGTTPTTVPDALLLPDDTQAARGTGVGADTLITMAGSFDFTGMQTDLIGINVYLKRPAQLDAFSASRHITIGLSRTGTHYMGTVAVAQSLHVDNVLVPPNTNYTFGGIGEGIFTAGLTQANFDTTTIRLLVA